MKKYSFLLYIWILLLSYPVWAADAAPQVPVNNATVPYGANLFSGNFQSQRNDGLDPNYRLVPGDKVALHMWGQVTIDEILTVDAKGNIFIPEVGEVRVEGMRSEDLSATVKQKVATVFKEGENVYVNVVNAAQISVFVTGPVLRPGQYTGTASDSVLTYLFKAGGIDPKRGSYRDVRVLRGNRIINHYDLYPFLTNGQIKPIRFKEGDTIVVGKLESTIQVSGNSRNPFTFEFKGRSITGKQLIQYAAPTSNVTNVSVAGTRNNKPLSTYLSYNQFLNTHLFDGDRVVFKSDAPLATINIHVEGNHLGNSYFTVKKGSRLKEVLDYIEVDRNEADIGNIYLKRQSIVAQQKRNLNESIQRLQRSVLTIPSQSEGEANIRTAEANLVLKFIEVAKEIEPEGRVVVSENGQVANIRLEENDVIVIPQKSDVVTISGEVMLPKAVVFAHNANLQDYIDRAGGFSERADRNRIVVMHPNGRVLINANQKITPGDQIIIFPRVIAKRLQNVKDLLQVITSIAVSAKAVGF